MRLKEVETQEDFDELLEIYATSLAPLDIKQEATNKAKAMFPQFDTSKHLPTQEVLQMIKEGEADISDMGGY